MLNNNNNNDDDDDDNDNDNNNHNNNNNNNNNNDHFTRTLSVLTSARVFMRRQPIPPLCGGAVQALPNIHTTLRHHPHPASRPMTFGHFTSWPADDRGYYTGVEYTPTEVVKPTFVHPQKLLSLVNPQKLLTHGAIRVIL